MSMESESESGAVFHPDHDELHGFTMVLEAGAMTYAGRWDQENNGQVILRDADQHQDGDEGLSSAEYIEQIAHRGVHPAKPVLVVPKSDITRMRKLGDITQESRGF